MRPAPLRASLLRQFLLLLLLRLFLSDFFFPLTPPRYLWPTVLALRPDPPASPLPELRAASPSQETDPVCPAPLAAAAAICPLGSRPPGIAGKKRQKRRSPAALRNRHRGEAGSPAAVTAGSGPRAPLRTSPSSQGQGVSCEAEDATLLFFLPKSGLWGRSGEKLQH